MDAAVVKGGTQVSRCACRRVCIAGAAAHDFSMGARLVGKHVAAVTLSHCRMALSSLLDDWMLKKRRSKEEEERRSMKFMESMPSQRYGTKATSLSSAQYLSNIGP